MNAYGFGEVLNSPKLNHTKDGMPVMTLNVLFDNSVKMGLSLYGEAAEIANNQIDKGMQVFFDGELREEKWMKDDEVIREVKMKVKYFRITNSNRPVKYFEG